MRCTLTIQLSAFFFALAAYLAPTDTTLLKAIEQKTTETQLFLKFESAQSDYLVFYDAEGSTLFLRYRRDKWDYDNDTLRDSLRQGITYIVKMRALQKFADGALPKGVLGHGLPKVLATRPIRRIREVFGADVLGINESALRDLRL